MIAKLKAGFSRIRGNLTGLDRQPLSKAALAVIIFLDIFILSSIFDGLAVHTAQLASPDDYIPATCNDMLISREWNQNNRTDNLANIIAQQNSRYYQPPQNTKPRHPICSPYLDLIEQIKGDKVVRSLLEERSKMKKEAGALELEIGNLQKGYDTSLLETIARQNEGQANVDKLRQDVRDKTNSLNSLRGRIGEVQRQIDDDARVNLLWGKLQNLQPSEREKLKADWRQLNFWYPLKKLAMQMIFLLPLLVVVYAWNNASIRKSRGIQILVSSHLLAISFIPVLFKIIDFFYEIIPKILLRKIFALLERFNLVAIWFYLIIAFAVMVSLFVIYVFQKKLFSREKLVRRRIEKGCCQECGRQLPHGARACPFCGFQQFKTCGSCQKPTHVLGSYCIECGRAQQSEVIPPQISSS